VRSPSSGELLLASASPQRRAILEQLGVPYEALVPGVQEVSAGPPEEVALENAYRKAAAVAAIRPRARVLAADTVVALGGRILDKPAGPHEASEHLRALSGREHRVIGGLCVIEHGRHRSAASVTTVSFRTLAKATIAWYLESGEWRGRAGGYAIQGRGAALVSRIEGDYLNVVGLPVARLLELLPDLLPGFGELPRTGRQPPA
jgi:septum formation protein